MGKTVLVVDDSASMRALLGVALRAAGFAVVEARDGRDALEQARRRPGRPHRQRLHHAGHGRDRRSSARSSRTPTLQRIPVIMLTTESQEAQIQEGRALGVQAWIVKPFQAGEVRRGRRVAFSRGRGAS